MNKCCKCGKLRPGAPTAFGWKSEWREACDEIKSKHLHIECPMCKSCYCPACEDKGNPERYNGPWDFASGIYSKRKP